MICPILFIRKPEEAECLKEHCGFWVKGEVLDGEIAAPERFSAVITGPADRHPQARQTHSDGKCAILTIAEAVTARNE